MSELPVAPAPEHSDAPVKTYGQGFDVSEAVKEVIEHRSEDSGVTEVSLPNAPPKMSPWQAGKVLAEHRAQTQPPKRPDIEVHYPKVAQGEEDKHAAKSVDEAADSWAEYRRNELDAANLQQEQLRLLAELNGEQAQAEPEAPVETPQYTSTPADPLDDLLTGYDRGEAVKAYIREQQVHTDARAQAHTQQVAAATQQQLQQLSEITQAAIISQFGNVSTHAADAAGAPGYSRRTAEPAAATGARAATASI